LGRFLRANAAGSVFVPLFFYFYSVGFLYKGGSAAAATPGPVLELPPPVAGLTVEPLRDQRGLVLPARAFIAFSCTVTGPFLFSRFKCMLALRKPQQYYAPPIILYGPIRLV